MTVSSQVSRADYNGNGVTTLFSVPFYFVDPTHLTVLSTVIATGVSTILTLATNYTVSGTGVSTGGSVTLLVAPAGTVRITILRNVPYLQNTHYVPNDPFPATSHEAALDLLTMEAQQINEILGRTVTFPSSDPTGISATIPNAVARAGKVFTFDSTGAPSVTNNAVDVTAVAANATNINTVSANIGSVNSVAANATNINTVAANNTNVTNVGGNIANVNAVAGNATNVNTVAANNTNVTNVGGSITNVNTVATNIAAVNTNATNITAIQNASTNATNAANSATSAATSATNAGNSATAAATSATNSATSATNAAAQLTSFKNIYYGPYATNPTTRPDTTAMQAGDEYYNTSSKALQIYNGTSWGAAGVVFNPIVQTFSGTGSQTTFTLSQAPGVVAALLVSIGGVNQTAGVDYTLSGTTLTFTTAPVAGTNNINTVNFGVAGTIGVPANASITNAMLQAGIVQPSNLSVGAPTWGNGTSLALPGATSQTGIGVSFPATQIASSDANTLDDYEEGTWSPTIVGWTGTYSAQIGQYTKIGNMVYLSGSVTTNGGTGTFSTVYLGSAPFTLAASQSNYGTVSFGGAGFTPGSPYTSSGSFDQATGSSFFTNIHTTGNTGLGNLSGGMLTAASSFNMRFNIVYKTT